MGKAFLIDIPEPGLMREHSCLKGRNDKGKKIPEHFPALLKFHLNLWPDGNSKLPENLSYLNHLIRYLTLLSKSREFSGENQPKPLLKIFAPPWHGT